MESRCQDAATETHENAEQDTQELLHHKNNHDVNHRTRPYRKVLHVILNWVCKCPFSKAMLSSRAKGSLFDAAKRGDVRECHRWEQIIDANDPKGSSLYWNKRDAKHRTLLMVASAGLLHEHKDFVDFLLSKNADVHAVDRHGKTALHYAVKFRKAQHTMVVNDVLLDTLVQSLIDYGANVLTQDNDGFTPFAIALEYGNVAAMCTLMQPATDGSKRDSLGLEQDVDSQEEEQESTEDEDEQEYPGDDAVKQDATESLYDLSCQFSTMVAAYEEGQLDSDDTWQMKVES